VPSDHTNSRRPPPPQLRPPAHQQHRL